MSFLDARLAMDPLPPPDFFATFKQLGDMLAKPPLPDDDDIDKVVKDQLVLTAESLPASFKTQTMQQIFLDSSVELADIFNTFKTAVVSKSKKDLGQDHIQLLVSVIQNASADAGIAVNPGDGTRA